MAEQEKEILEEETVECEESTADSVKQDAWRAARTHMTSAMP